MNEELKLRSPRNRTTQNQLRLENQNLQEEIKLTHNFEETISRSKNFQKVLHQIQRVASTDATVLITSVNREPERNSSPARCTISATAANAPRKVELRYLPANLIEKANCLAYKGRVYRSA